MRTRRGWMMTVTSVRRILMNRCIVTALVFLAGCAGTGIYAEDRGLTEKELAIVREVNLARTRPWEYAAFLDETRKFYSGRMRKGRGTVWVKTQEGLDAVEEAAEFLRGAAPVASLRLSNGMSRAARDHVAEQGRGGAVGHGGLRGSSPGERVNRYGVWKGMVGENIVYSEGSPRDTVMRLIVDDGVPSRGHRTNLFHPGFRSIGIACGSHAVYGEMCVITLAGDYDEK
jgi:uncharacterized protein YkwD